MENRKTCFPFIFRHKRVIPAVSGHINECPCRVLRQTGGSVRLEKTMTFSLGDDKEQEMKVVLTTVYDALREKGYNPINQIVGYLLSEDPTYITTHNNARSLIRRIDRDELLKAMVRSYLGE